MISIEYCHVTPGDTWKEQIEKSNLFASNFIKVYGKEKIQKCIMIDDLHCSERPDVEEIDDFVSELKLQPDCIYLESTFVQYAQEVLDKLDLKKISFIEDNERVWLGSLKDKYRGADEMRNFDMSDFDDSFMIF